MRGILLFALKLIFLALVLCAVALTIYITFFEPKTYTNETNREITLEN